MTPYQARKALTNLRATMVYAYANGHGCSLGWHPFFEEVHAKEAALLAIINPEETPG